MPFFKFISLTPIVTGDYEKSNEKLLATGLIGSLRYQYWLMKALEGYLNGNTGIHNRLPLRGELADEQYKKDPNNPENLKNALKGAGPVIQLFGTTGWKRVFHLEVVNCSRISGKIQSSSRLTEKSAPYLRKFGLRFRLRKGTQYLRNCASEEPNHFIDPEKEIKNLVAFVHKWGWLGAAPQNGFGWVKCEDPPDCDSCLSNGLVNNPIFYATDVELTHKEFNTLRTQISDLYKQKVNEYPSDAERRKMKRYKFSLGLLDSCDPFLHGLCPIGYEIRRYLKTKMNGDYFGKGGKNGHASYIHVSHPISSESGVLIRLRFCNRPGNGFLSIDPPKVLIEKCQKILKGVRTGKEKGKEKGK